MRPACPAFCAGVSGQHHAACNAAFSQFRALHQGDSGSAPASVALKFTVPSLVFADALAQLVCGVGRGWRDKVEHLAMLQPGALERIGVRLAELL
jgi:hypothetical protein